MEQLTFGFDAPSKRCTKCGKQKVLDAFGREKRMRDGRTSQCRDCKADQKRRHYAENRDLHSERARRQYQVRRDAVAAYQLANREHIKEQRKIYVASLSGQQRERFLAMRRRASAAYLKAHPDECSQRIRAWQAANPDKLLDVRHRRRSRLNGNGSPERFTRTEIGERDGWVCWICSEPVDAGLPWPERRSPSLDHVVPLALGGGHTRANCKITHLICNVRKGARVEPAAVTAQFKAPEKK